MYNKSTMPTTYLEYVKDNSAKFYRVELENGQLKIRYGKINTNGTSSVKDLQDPEKAEKEYAKVIKAKKKKGYVEADESAPTILATAAASARPKRRAAKKTASSKVWVNKIGPSKAFAITVHCHDYIWTGDESGTVCSVNKDGESEQTFKLPVGLKALCSDGNYLYAGCNDGSIWDLCSQKIPVKMFSVEHKSAILWMDIIKGHLFISDENGGLTCISYEGEKIWSVSSRGSSGWMVRADADRVYHGTSVGIFCYDWDGNPVWEETRCKNVLFGYQSLDLVYACSGGGDVWGLDKQSGEIKFEEKVRGASFPSMAVSPTSGCIYASGSNKLYKWQNINGTWKKSVQYTGTSAMSAAADNDMVYLISNNLSTFSENFSQAVTSRTVSNTKAAVAVATTTSNEILDRVTEASTGQVTLHCIKVSGKLRVRPLTDGYETSFNVQFPRNLREEGTKYVVDGLTLENGPRASNFYRAVGNIRVLSA